MTYMTDIVHIKCYNNGIMIPRIQETSGLFFNITELWRRNVLFFPGNNLDHTESAQGTCHAESQHPVYAKPVQHDAADKIGHDAAEPLGTDAKQSLGFCVILCIHDVVHVVDRGYGEDGIGRPLHILPQCSHGNAGCQKQDCGF